VRAACPVQVVQQLLLLLLLPSLRVLLQLLCVLMVATCSCSGQRAGLCRAHSPHTSSSS